MRRRWLRFILVLLAVLLAGSFGLSLTLRGGWARRSLLARLSAGFGRPVEVGNFGFSLLGGLRLQAQSVTVDEDPRFGQEYFLRAEQLTASLRWSALLRGRFELGTVSLTRPSLNLVRLENGQWNIESWLPPLPPADAAVPNAGGGAAAARAGVESGAIGGAAAQISRIEVEGGRINFKRDSRKLALALVAVTGRFDHDAAGHWNIDVQANPVRAPVLLQQAGTLRVRGVVGGVSTRLRPASLALRWEDASLADLSRLMWGRDSGIRGTLDADLSARIDEAPSPAPSWGEWAVDGTLRLQGVHGWALAGRATDPSTNIRLQAKWRPADYRLLISRYVIEAPQSQLAGSMDLDWSRGFHPRAQVASSRVGLDDLLAWRRAFRADVADGLAAEGTLQAQASLSGWPVHIDELALASEGAAIRSAALSGPIRVGPIAAQWTGDTLKILRTTVSLPSAAPAVPRARGSVAVPPDAPTQAPPGALLIEGSIGPLPEIRTLANVRYRVAFSGTAPRTQDLLAIAHDWGSSAASTWTAEGPISLQVTLAGALGAGTPAANGTIQARGLLLTTAFLNRPLLLAAATIDLRGDQRRISLQSAQALGGRWTGSLRSQEKNGAWDFDLSADRLDAADFYAWLGSQDRPNLLRRILPFGASSETVGPARTLDKLKASGRLRVAELVFSPLKIERIDAAATVADSSLVLHQGHADLFGGQWTGKFEARLSPDPTYSFDGQFARLDLRDLAESLSLPGHVNGLAAGELKLAANGSDRAALAASIRGQGTLRSREAQLGQFNLAEAPASGAPEPPPAGDERPSAITASFHVGARNLRIDELLLTRAREKTEVTGTVDFERRLDLRLQSSPRSHVTAADDAEEPAAWSIVGTLDSPRIAAIQTKTPNKDAEVPSASVGR